jgi:hypothetical protein
MKFDIILNGVKVSKDIPTGWHQVSFRKFIEISKHGNDFNGIISAFTDVPIETLKQAKIKNFDVLLSCLAFMQKPVDQLMPSTICGLPVPKSLESEAVVRYGDLQEITKQFVKDDDISNLQHYPSIVATYVTPSPYDLDQANALAEQIWDSPCGEVLAIGNFTLARLLASRSGMLNSSHLEGTLKNRFKRAMINWLTRMAFSIRYTTWKRSLPLNVRRSLNGH